MQDTQKPLNADDDLNFPPPSTRSADELPAVLKYWDRLWDRLVRLGLSDVALRVGSALVTIGLVGLVVWVMKGFFVGGEFANPELDEADAIQQNGMALPAYEGSAPVAGLSRSADSQTTAAEFAGSRYDIVEYEVVSGDTIFGIADKYGLSTDTILWSNWATLRDNPAAIYPGQKLDIPPQDGVVIIWYEENGLNGVAKNLNVTPEDIINWPSNNLSLETIGDFANPNIEAGTKLFVPGGWRPFYDWTTAIFGREETATSPIWGQGKCAPTNLGPTGNGTYIWPTSERRVSGYPYSPETNHYGIDIGGATGNPIYSVDNGVVVYSGWSDWGYGNVIAIDHGTGMQTLYAHLSTINVGCGAFVTQGDVIGAMGSTGNSSGPHLHFEMRLNGGRVNPHNYVGY